MLRLVLLLLYKQLVVYGPNDPLLNSNHLTPPPPPLAISNAHLGGGGGHAPQVGKRCTSATDDSLPTLLLVRENRP